VKAVVAFGGNAIARADQAGTFEEQMANLRSMANALAALVEHGVSIVITHGNGPQVGRIAIQQEAGHRQERSPAMPFDACGAMSEGLIGYMLQQSLRNTLRVRDSRFLCATVITQVTVAADDPAFQNPTKPVGGFYSKSEAAELERKKRWTMVEDAGRGYRRVVPSPKPLEIVEWPAISALLDAGFMVIAAGGGGIPVVEEAAEAGKTRLRGVEAVIDKDRASARLAALVGADTLILLTDVERVAVGYGTPSERWLDLVSVEEMRGYLEAGEFPPGSMGPKVESAIRFVDDGGRRAIITSTSNLVEAFMSGSGTRVISNPDDASEKKLRSTTHG